MDQRLAGPEQDARQSRLAMETDGPSETKIHERTEGAAKTVQTINGDSFSANRIQAGPKTISTSFGVKAEPLALSCSNDVVVENGAEAPILIFKDAHNNSHRWLTSHRQNLYNQKDHL